MKNKGIYDLVFQPKGFAKTEYETVEEMFDMADVDTDKLSPIVLGDEEPLFTAEEWTRLAEASHKICEKYCDVLISENNIQNILERTFAIISNE